MNLLHRRGWLLVAAASLFAGGAIGIACGPNNNGSDGGGVDSGGSDVTNGDSGKTDGQSNNEGGPQNDGGPITCEAGISGSCDIYAQNCGTGQECAVVKTDAGFQTQCVSNTTGSIKEGFACTQSGNSNPCVAGLECIQNRCSKHCCFGDDSVCGKSQPEGYTGRCDITVTVNGTDPAYSVCTYSASCEPFQQQPCAAGQTCGVTDQNGTAKCTTIDTPDGGLPEKATCQYANDCKDGMVCAGAADGGFACTWACYHPPGPFDAGIANAQPGYGGCPSGETCKVPLGNSPSWYYLCSK